MKRDYEIPADSTTVHQRGASLLEAIAFLGIAAVVILGAVSLLGGAFSSSNINRVSTEVVTFRTNISKLYIGQRDFGAANTNLNTSINTANMAPATLTWNTTKWTNAFQGDVNVVSWNTAYILEYTNVPADACVPLVMTAAGWAWVLVNDTASTAAPTKEDAAKGNYSPSANTLRTLPNVTTSCSSKTNNIRFVGTL